MRTLSLQILLICLQMQLQSIEKKITISCLYSVCSPYFIKKVFKLTSLKLTQCLSIEEYFPIMKVFIPRCAATGEELIMTATFSTASYQNSGKYKYPAQVCSYLVLPLLRLMITNGRYLHIQGMHQRHSEKDIYKTKKNILLDLNRLRSFILKHT